jgi:hypothetical protein
MLNNSENHDLINRQINMRKINFITIAIYFFSILFTFSCKKDELATTPAVTGNGGGGSSFYGIWNRIVQSSGDRTDIAIGGITGEPANRVYMCELTGSTAAGFYKGTLNGNTIVWDSQYGIPNFVLTIVGSNMELNVPSCSTCITTTYVSGSWSGQCVPLNGGGGGGGSGTGNVMFWIQSDLGCGAITVTLNGQSGSIVNYYSSGAPSCGATGCANFSLPAGTYSFSASCSSYTWNGTVTSTSGGCYRMNLHL